ncbi:MAG: adenosylcobinamide-GDP ribazoletransferase [Aestuariivita sp.]|nr:adenosylcobinamide-GDP ribazoletransferase [Aestuariivita sp.]
MVSPVHKNSIWSFHPSDIIVALTLLTRLPLGNFLQADFDRQASATWAFPIAGLAVSSIAAIIAFVTLSMGFNAALVAGLTLISLIITTGGLHEDGLADTVDGFWGGHSIESRLEIMSDSTIGTYGILALISTIGLRWISLTLLLPVSILPLLAVAALSRAGMSAMMAWVPLAKKSGISAAIGAPPVASVATAACIALTVGWLILGAAILPVALIAILVFSSIAILTQQKICGQTGDVLGAAQQVCETVCLVFIAFSLA